MMNMLKKNKVGKIKQKFNKQNQVQRRMTNVCRANKEGIRKKRKCTIASITTFLVTSTKCQ